MEQTNANETAHDNPQSSQQNQNVSLCVSSRSTSPLLSNVNSHTGSISHRICRSVNRRSPLHVRQAFKAKRHIRFLLHTLLLCIVREPQVPSINPLRIRIICQVVSLSLFLDRLTAPTMLGLQAWDNPLCSSNIERHNSLIPRRCSITLCQLSICKTRLDRCLRLRCTRHLLIMGQR